MWTKLDDGFADHPKVLAVGHEAERLFVHGLIYCNKLLTDGFIPADVVPRLAPAPGSAARNGGLADRLVDTIPAGYTVGLWERVDGGFHVHDFLDHNESRAQVIARRQRIAEQRRLAGQGRARSAARANGRFTSETPAEPLGAPLEHDDQRSTSESAGGRGVTSGPGGVRSPAPSRPVLSGSGSGDLPPSPDLLPVGSCHVSSSAQQSALADATAGAGPPALKPRRRKPGAGTNGFALDPNFEALWEQYPRRESKHEARALWAQLHGGLLLRAQIEAALSWQVDLPDWREGKVPYFVRYLRGRRWEDERPPAGAAPRDAKMQQTLEAGARFIAAGGKELP